MLISTPSGEGIYDVRRSAREGSKRGAQEVEEESVHLLGAVFHNPVARVLQALDARGALGTPATGPVGGVGQDGPVLVGELLPALSLGEDLRDPLSLSCSLVI